MNPQLYLTNVLQSTDYNIPIEANYSVAMYDIARVAANLITNKDIISDNKLNIKQELGLIGNRFMGDTGELFLAASVNLPGENVSSGRVGYTGENTLYGGLLPGPVLKGRQNLDNLGIAFIETNKSFLDYFLRAWVVAASQFGLYSKQDPESTQNFKTTLEITFYDKIIDGTTPRKIIKFNEAVPVDVKGYEAGYGKSTGIRTAQTSWIYSTYEIK